MSWYSVPNFIVALYTLTLGVIVLRANPKSDNNKACFLLACTSFVWLFSYGLLYSTQDTTKALVFAKIGHGAAILLTPVVYYFLVSVLGSYRKNIDIFLWKVSCVAASLTLFLLYTSPLYIKDLVRHYWGLYLLGGPLMIAYIVFTFFAGFCGILRFAQASARARIELKVDDYRRFKFYAISLSIFILGAVDYLPKFGANVDVYPFGYIFVGTFSSLITYAILKHKLLDVDIIIRRSFIYSSLVFIITSIYLAVILIGEYFFRSFFGYASLIMAIVASSIIALTFNPLREKIQKIIDSRFFKIDPEVLANENLRLKAVVQDQDRMKAVATLAAGMAHEIKNPLTAIKTFTEHLPRNSTDPAFLEKFSKIVGSEVDKVDAIVKQLLEFSRPTPPKMERVDLSQIIDATLHLLDAEFVKSKITIVRQFENNGIWVQGDKKQLQQVFLNLFLNSIQAMPQAGTLTVSIFSSGNQIKISVSDTGYGISKSDLSHIFDPFFTTKESGTGLGLAITHGIILEHGGKIAVSSSLGNGTTFLIEFIEIHK